MKSIALNIVIMVTTFLIGSSLTSVIRVHKRSARVCMTRMRSIPLKGCRGIGFGLSSKEVSRSKMEMECDGMHFTIYQAPFNSIEEASNEFERRLEGAQKIVSRETIFDRNGTQIGEVIVALLQPNDLNETGENKATLIRRKANEVLEVRSSSLPNILEYKRDFLK
jgi:hypothetical protein